MKFFIKLHKFKGERLRGFRQYTKVTYELYAFKFLEIGIRHLRSVPLQLVHFVKNKKTRGPENKIRKIRVIRGEIHYPQIELMMKAA